MLTIMTLMVATLLVSGILAAWPLLLSRMVRPAAQGAGGTLCVVAGAAGFFALASGLAGNSSDAGCAVAAEATESKQATNADESAFFTTAESGALNSPIPDSIDGVKIIGNPPAWVDKDPVRDGSIHTAAVRTIPFESEHLAKKALDEELEKQTADYIEWALGSPFAPKFIHFNADQIRQELRLVSPDNTYHDTVVSETVGTMHREHALLEFKPEFRERIGQQWQQVKAKWRLAQIGLVAGGAILLLSTVFSYFRLDNATRGYYTGRLQFLSAAAILAIVAAAVIVGKWWIYWL